MKDLTSEIDTSPSHLRNWLRGPKFHYNVHEVYHWTIFWASSVICISVPHFLKINFEINFCQCLGLPCDLLYSGFLIKTVYTFLIQFMPGTKYLTYTKNTRSYKKICHNLDYSQTTQNIYLIWSKIVTDGKFKLYCLTVWWYTECNRFLTWSKEKNKRTCQHRVFWFIWSKEKNKHNYQHAFWLFVQYR
jgi:hypothetical protein